LHFALAQYYLFEDEVIVQLWVSESNKLKRGQWGRYCSTCDPGLRNEKVSIIGIHIPVALLGSDLTPPIVTSPPRDMKPFTPTIPLEIDSEAVVTWPYSGKECAENKQSSEGGYLKLNVGEKVTILSRAEAGHTSNGFPFYVYCKNTKGECGWAPQLILHRQGYGAFGVVTGLAKNQEFNDTIVRVHGLRDDGRVIVETEDHRQIAAPLARVHIFDFEEDFGMLQKKGITAVRFVHPDKGGCPESLRLLIMISRCKVAARAQKNL